MKRRAGRLSTGFVALYLVAPVVSVPPADAGGHTLMIAASQAAPAAAMLDTMGVTTHFGWLDTPYGTRFPDLLDALVRLGVTRVRDTVNERIPALARAGIRTTLLVDPTDAPEVIRDRIERLNGAAAEPNGERHLAVDAVEATNEPDTYWAKLGHSYAGQGYPDGVREFTRDLRAALRSGPGTASLVLIGPALSIDASPGRAPPAALAALGRWVDWGNIHPYPYNGGVVRGGPSYGGLRDERADSTHPSVTLDAAMRAATAADGLYPGRPLAATETGFPAALDYTPEDLQARYIPRLYAEYFRAGVRRTFVYQLADAFPDPTNRDPELAFGLLRHDFSERPAFRTVSALTALLRGRSPRGDVPADLRLHLHVGTREGFPDASRVHTLLLRRPGGALLLLLWHEVSGEDASIRPRRRIDVPAMPATVRPDRHLHCTAHDLDGGPSRSAPCGPGRPFTIDVPDAVVAVEISGRSRQRGE